MKNGGIYWISESDGEYLIYINALIIPKEESNQINLDEITFSFQNWGRTRKN